MGRTNLILLLTLIAVPLMMFGVMSAPALDMPAAPAQATSQQSILVWTMFDPWRTVIGSDSPRFALYINNDPIW